ncbi:heterokaryon incompatibility protein-domain-containing protein [Xylariaceae sp. FL1651]|nr:heterokaryon incompatibility protein-domain-containing protein [Xylariaceae sp. FL1651]
MRLLKTERYELVEANDVPEPFPQYAILSHTWISPKDEITYQDFKQRKGDIENDIFKQKGWAKLKGYCDRAAKDGWDWAWMDTCCIDKTNPADTQEAINAMFRWYQGAGICYAYLEDVDASKVLDHLDIKDGGSSLDLDLDDIASRENVADPTTFPHMALKAFLIKAKWFTRGWTLQELLAPPYLVFVDRKWRRIGTRESWADEINQASRIGAHHLTSFDPVNFTSCSIAMRLSWASRRETTVEEDETYSLLGLFGISLPLIYGEGRLRAFDRLQRELITVYNDDSIFAWKALQPLSKYFAGTHQKGYNPRRGILAPSIREFWDAFSIKSFGFYGNSFSMTNRGLEITAKRWRYKDDPTKCLIRLNCGIEISRHIGIPLSHVDDSYERIQVGELYDMRTVDRDQWEEESGSQSTFIRASSDLNFLVPSSIFSIMYPEQIIIGEKYCVDYRTTMVGSIRRLAGSSSDYDLKKDELIIEPNQLVFINIAIQCGGSKLELDIIINLADNGFPSAGIMARGRERWERFGDPLQGASGKYEALADYLHNMVPPVYPVVAPEQTDSVIGICLLPRPPLKRSFKLPPEKAKYIRPREYVVKVTIGNDRSLSRDDPEHYKGKRKRDP